jgi:hypothetical protein
VVSKLSEKPYSRKEIEEFGDGFPNRGRYCPKCKTYIPVFEDLRDTEKHRIRKLILSNQKMMAIAELKTITGCSERWAKIWVNHSGRPTPEYPGPPCPYCGKELRTSLAKQCPHCLMQWRDPNNPKKIGGT